MAGRYLIRKGVDMSKIFKDQRRKEEGEENDKKDEGVVVVKALEYSVTCFDYRLQGVPRQ